MEALEKRVVVKGGPSRKEGLLPKAEWSLLAGGNPACSLEEGRGVEEVLELDKGTEKDLGLNMLRDDDEEDDIGNEPEGFPSKPISSIEKFCVEGSQKMSYTEREIQEKLRRLFGRILDKYNRESSKKIEGL